MVLVLLTLFAASSGFAQTLSNSAALRRCYFQLSGSPVPEDSTWMSRAKSGEPAGQLCTQILEDVVFGTDGTLTVKSTLNYQVVERFHQVHREWISKKWIGQSDYVPDYYFGTMDIYDGAEPSYYLTRGLFAGLQFNSVLRGNSSLRSVRELSTVIAANKPNNFSRITRIISLDVRYDENYLHTSTDVGPFEDGFIKISSLLVPVGRLAGVVVEPDASQSPNIWIDSLTDRAQLNPEGLQVPQLIHINYGGGAMGSIPYLLMNFGHPTGYYSNGTTKLPRRWIQSVLDDFLCRAVPAIRESDITSLVRPSAVAPFRQQASCVRCHATLDQAAMTARNLKPTTFANAFMGLFPFRTSITLSRYQADQAAASDQEAWPVQDVANFNRQAPQGVLMFRSVNGQLVQRSVNGIDELGQALSDTDDFYACAAKKYLQYFTGVKIELNDSLDPANVEQFNSLSTVEREARQFALDLGKELRQTGSLKQLIKRILASDMYRKTDFNRSAK